MALLQNFSDVTVTEGLHGQRLDSALVALLPDLSRTRIKNLILAGMVGDGEAALVKPARKVHAGDELSIEIPPLIEADPQPENIPLSILFEDEDVVVIDKPIGLVVHPAPGHAQGTLVNALLHHCGNSLSGINGVKRPGIVHRLDKDTSGVMVVAKNDAAHQALSEQFVEHGRDGRLERGYIAFAWERIRFGEMHINAPIGRDPANRLRMKVLPHGREAMTHIKETAFYENGKAVVAKLAATLETGRTHQIRVHLNSVGHPLLGDALYGAGFKSKAALLEPEAQAALAALGERQALHAARLAFCHPRTQEKLFFESPLPEDLQSLEAALANN